MARSATYWASEQSYPDPIRIAALSAAIALNIAAMGLLMRPPEFSQPTQRAEPTHVSFVVRLPMQPPTPIAATVAKPHTQPTSAQPRPIQHEQLAATLDAAPARTDSVVPQHPNTLANNGDPGTIAPTQPAEVGLNPIASPAPTYPRDALRDGITGTVVLELLVGVDGRVVEVHVTRGSGNRLLDNAARDQVLRNWRFEPAMRDGIPVQALGRVPIVFTLDGR